MTSLPTASTANDLPIIDLSEKIIHGIKVKFNDGVWLAEEQDVTGKKLLVLYLTRIVQHWQGSQPIETYIDGKDVLPDVDKLNDAIPKSEWETWESGDLKEPWVLSYVVYMFDEDSAELYTHVNSTFGLKLAYDRLNDKIKWNSSIKGQPLRPYVRLSSTRMKTGRGTKMRPDFRTEDGWVVLGGSAVARLEPAPPLVKVAPPTTEEAMRDSIPY